MSKTVQTATMQLVQPIAGMESYLTGDPQRSLFTACENMRHAPYATNTISVPFGEKVGFGKTISATIPDAGDLLQDIHLSFRLPALSLPPGSTFVGYTNAVGYAMIDTVELRIGEKVIVSRTGLFLEVMDYLQTDVSKQDAR